MMPFTREVFLRLLDQYAAVVWPAQIIALALAAGLVFLAVRPRPWSDRMIAAMLALAWAWTGVVFHGLYLATLVWAAWGFAALFVLQGLVLAWSGIVRGQLAFRFRPTVSGWAGLALIAFAAVLDPLLWQRAPMIGLMPGSTTVFTVGLLAMIQGRTPHHLLVIPLLWALIGGAAAWAMGVPAGLALALAVVFASIVIVARP